MKSGLQIPAELHWLTRIFETDKQIASRQGNVALWPSASQC